uniref:HAT C-terminal dimerisation domain-containing protein n=1 Tax=Latimeria chalumnae TaxID=7897 RepID=H3A3S8_LATCH
YCCWGSERNLLTLKHKKSDLHNETKRKYMTRDQPSLMVQLNDQLQRNQIERRKMLVIQLSSVHFLLRQGMAIRGHDELQGNLQQLLLLRAEDNPGISNRNYLSHDIVNKMISLMGNALLRSKLHQIQQCRWYATTADEATDLSKQKQMAICIRWVDKFFKIHEDCIGLLQLDATDSQYLTTVVKDILVCCMLPLSACQGQAYDGTGNMAGKLHGLAARTRKIEPAALTFEQFQKQFASEEVSIKPLCPTRWTVRTGAIMPFLNYRALVECCQEINLSRNDEYGRIAGGVLAQLEQFKVYFGLRLAHLIFSATEQTSRVLQRKDCSFQEDSGTDAHQFETPEAFFRQQYFEAFDITAGKLKWCFEQSMLAAPRAIENLLISYANEEGNQLQDSENLIPQVIQVNYAKDLDLSHLQNQLRTLPDLIRAANKNVPTLNITKVTKLSTLIDVFNAVPFSDVLFSEVHSLLCLFLTLPVSTAIAERSFSALRRLKTFLRSTMTQERLNNSMLLYVHKSSTDELNMTEIAQEF